MSVGACSDPVTATRIVDRRPPAHLMVPCKREPEPPPDGASQEAQNLWVVGLIGAGEDCRKTADGFREHHAAPK